MQKFLNFIKSAFYTVVVFIMSHKITSAIVLAVIAGITAAAIVVSSILSVPAELILSNSKVDSTVSSTTSSEPVSSEDTSSELPPVSSEEQVSSQEPVSSEEITSDEDTVVSTPSVSSETVSESTTPVKVEYVYNGDMTPDSNVFLDALEFTGYNLNAQRNSGKMWASGSNYVLSTQKRGLGWLSNITYDDYGRASGYETNIHGQPDIAYFESKGLVCATYAAYVYFNFLPNVAGIDTSMLPRPAKSYSANDWYLAGQQWVNLGYSRYISFTASDGGSIYRDLEIYPEEQIPIGSLIILCDWYNRSQWCSHICIYAGYVNDYHWVTHVGNENGPEFCAIERMNRKPHPQWPIAIITPPNCINLGE